MLYKYICIYDLLFTNGVYLLSELFFKMVMWMTYNCVMVCSLLCKLFLDMFANGYKYLWAWFRILLRIVYKCLIYLFINRFYFFCDWKLFRSGSIAQSLDRSIAQSLDHSIARSLDRSIAPSLNRSIARSLGRSGAWSLFLYAINIYIYRYINKYIYIYIYIYIRIND